MFITLGRTIKSSDIMLILCEIHCFFNYLRLGSKDCFIIFILEICNAFYQFFSELYRKVFSKASLGGGGGVLGSGAPFTVVPLPLLL